MNVTVLLDCANWWYSIAKAQTYWPTFRKTHPELFYGFRLFVSVLVVPYWPKSCFGNLFFQLCKNVCQTSLLRNSTILRSKKFSVVTHSILHVFSKILYIRNVVNRDGQLWCFRVRFRRHFWWHFTFLIWTAETPKKRSTKHRSSFHLLYHIISEFVILPEATAEA